MRRAHSVKENSFPPGCRARCEENCPICLAVLEADRLNLPLIVHQGLDPTYPHTNDRIHSFVLEKANVALRWMIELNDKYALDGRDPNS